MYEHDYDGTLAKVGKRHLGKTRWTREEVCKKSLKFLSLDKLMSDYCSDNHILSFIQDEKLKKLVELHGSEDWKLIASLLAVS